MALNQVSVVPAGVLRVISDGLFGPNRCIFEGGPPPFSESKCPQVWARKFGSDPRGDWALRRFESSFWGTGWGAKGDFNSYLYPYMNGEPIPFSKAHALCYGQSWEWSDAYSWRNDLWKVNFKRVCKKPAGVLMVIWSRVHFRRGPPTIFRKHMPSGMGTESYGPDVYSRRFGHWIKFQNAKGDFGCIFKAPIRAFSKGECKCPQVWALGVIGCIFAENGPLEGGIGYRLGWHWRVISCVILTYTRFSSGEPIPFSKAHALCYRHSKDFVEMESEL